MGWCEYSFSRQRANFSETIEIQEPRKPTDQKDQAVTDKPTSSPTCKQFNQERLLSEICGLSRNFASLPLKSRSRFTILAAASRGTRSLRSRARQNCQPFQPVSSSPELHERTYPQPFRLLVLIHREKIHRRNHWHRPRAFPRRPPRRKPRGLPRP